jgi:prepilin-type processing-associated H-X9-DG protein
MDFAHSPGGGAYLNVAYADGHVSSLSFADYQKQSKGDEAQSDFFALGWTK